MKTTLQLTVILILALTVSCMDNANLESEREAIIKAIEKEAEGVTNLDYNQWASQWTQNENAHFVWTSRTSHIFKSGWDEIGPYVKGTLGNMDEVERLEKKNLKIHINDNSALVFYDEYAYNANNELMLDLLTTKLLEKKNGNWKVTYNANVNRSSIQNNQNLEKKKEPSEQ
jgi:hypothetical protein